MGEKWGGWVAGIRRGMGAYAAVKDILVAGVIVDVDCDAAEGGDLGGEFIEAGVVLPRGW